MPKRQTEHAQKVVDRFRELLRESGDDINDAHGAELALLIEAAIETSLIDHAKKLAERLDALAHSVRHDAEFFSD